MWKRLFDILCAAVALLVLAPVFLVAAIGIRLCSPGPILYRARRMGRNGQIFVMHKFRTMHHAERPASAITGANDPRVFGFGSLLRRLKIDELPQLYDVLLGKMSIVGPRPEDPGIVQRHYNQAQWETLRCAPGLASPGSIFNYTHGDDYLHGDDPERAYVEGLLPIKLALEQVYVRRASFGYDLQIIFRTLWVIVLITLGKSAFPDPPEMAEARALLRESEPHPAGVERVRN